MNTGILILAAGVAAFRMNQPKMLLSFGKGSILSHILNEARSVKAEQICLVTGYYHKEIVESVKVADLLLVHNEHWREGMASSISKGVKELSAKYPETDTIMILVSDQPHINRTLLTEMIVARKKTGKGIVAAQYGKVNGTPVLFDKKYFGQLLSLTGDAGAKSILQKHPDDVTTVAFSLGAIDIDTAEDYEQLTGKTKK